MGMSIRFWLLVAVLLGGSMLLVFPSSAAGSTPSPLITGNVYDSQGVPVEGAVARLYAGDEPRVLVAATTQANGRYTLSLPDGIPETEALILQIDRPHFEEMELALEDSIINRLRNEQSVVLPGLTLSRQITAAFWIATAVFILVLTIIAASDLHNTLAALIGAVLLLAASYLGSPIHRSLYIFDFERALHYVDWDVIFLIMGMMIFIAVVEQTGIFQWLAFAAFRFSGGRMWLLLTILMLVAGVASAFLDNVTTMLLMTPITVQIALALNINPLSLLVPEVMASNVIGVSTLVGTPTNILIGSYGNISFNDFLVNLTPGVLMAFLGLVLYSLFIYRRELRTASDVSPRLLDRLAKHAAIAEPDDLRKAGWIGAAMLLLFVFGERIHLLPAVTALMGATALLFWIKPDIEEMIHAVDWTTLVFFIALFMVVGAIQEVGLISLIADLIGQLVGGNLLFSMLAVVWLGALLSTVVANIPFTAAMLPVVDFLSGVVPGASNKVLFYSLSVGSAMGGNGSLIGASANLVTAGIAERAGYPITYGYFLKKGLPALLVTVGLATVWLLWRFLVPAG